MMRRPKLTAPERRVYEFIRDYITENAYPPSHREIADACDYASTSTVFHTLNRLERKGYLDIGRKSSRALRVVS